MQTADDLASERDLLQVAADGLRHELSNVRQQLAEQQVMLCHVVSVGELNYNLCQRQLSTCKAGHTSPEKLVLSILTLTSTTDFLCQTNQTCCI